MEKEFKIGDKVKIIKLAGSHNKIVDIGIITEYVKNSSVARVTVEGRKNELNWSNISNIEHYQEEIVLDVILEEEFKLPEKWCILRTLDNYDVINKWFKENNYGQPFARKYYIYTFNRNHGASRNIPIDYTEITFEQFKKYVLKEKPEIEPLPFFKILTGDNAENTIFRVQNNEGNIFQIGDKVKSITGKITNPENMIIKGFRYTKNKDNICAVTKRLEPYGIGIDKIEHVLEFKKDEIILDIIESKIPENESNLDKAKRLYPIGTEFIPINTHSKCIIQGNLKLKDGQIHDYDDNDHYITTKCDYHFIFGYDNTWAEIISKPEIKEEVVITSSLKDMLTLQNAKIKNIVTIQSEKEETLLEKAKRLFPIGTHFEGLGLYHSKGKHFIVNTLVEIGTLGNIITYPEHGNRQAVISKDGLCVAKILYNGYKIGDTINVSRKYNSLTEFEFDVNVLITRLQTINNQEVAFFGKDLPHNRILIKNIKK